MFMKNIKVLFLIFIIMFGLNSLTPMMYGDDYVYASGLNYDDALDVKNKVQLIPGAYSYIEKDN